MADSGRRGPLWASSTHAHAAVRAGSSPDRARLTYPDRMRGVVAGALLLSALAVGCGDESERVSDEPSQGITGGAGTPGTGDGSPDTTAQESTNPKDSVRSSCEFDSQAGERVVLESTQDAMVVEFEGLPVPQQGTVLYAVTVVDTSGENSAQLGMEFTDGALAAYFVLDHSSAQQTNLPGRPSASRDVLRGRFPLDQMGAVGVDGVTSWWATLTVNGVDLGRCPSGPSASQTF